MRVGLVWALALCGCGASSEELANLRQVTTRNATSIGELRDDVADLQDALAGRDRGDSGSAVDTDDGDSGAGDSGDSGPGDSGDSGAGDLEARVAALEQLTNGLASVWTRLSALEARAGALEDKDTTFRADLDALDDDLGALSSEVAALQQGGSGGKPAQAWVGAPPVSGWSEYTLSDSFTDIPEAQATITTSGPGLLLVEGIAQVSVQGGGQGPFDVQVRVYDLINTLEVGRTIATQTLPYYGVVTTEHQLTTSGFFKLSKAGTYLVALQGKGKASTKAQKESYVRAVFLPDP